MKRYEIDETLATADIMFRAYGKTLNQAFENAGYAMFEIMTDTKKVKSELIFSFEKQAEDFKSLLYDFLEELLFIQESKLVFLSKFKVEINPKNHSLKAIVKGEKINDSHERRSVVKAVTYFDMSIIETKDGYTVQVLLDI
jgi:SHS2 domain-containing protein